VSELRGSVAAKAHLSVNIH